MKNSYLFVDYGNSNIKVGIYDLSSKKVNEIHFDSNDKSVLSIIKKFKTLKSCNIQRIFVASTVKASKTNVAIKQLFNYFKADTKLITLNDFKGLLDFTNISKDIGTDLLLLGLFGSTIYPKSAIICLGTVYSTVVMNKNKYESVLLIPSIAKGLNDISSSSSIPSKCIPNKYDKNIGLVTKDCFAAGANLSIEGLVDNIVKKYKLKPSNVFITGGDSDRYLNISKKYKVIDNLTLRAIALLVK